MLKSTCRLHNDKATNKSAAQSKPKYVSSRSRNSQLQTVDKTTIFELPTGLPVRGTGWTVLIPAGSVLHSPGAMTEKALLQVTTHRISMGDGTHRWCWNQSYLRQGANRPLLPAVTVLFKSIPDLGWVQCSFHKTLHSSNGQRNGILESFSCAFLLGMTIISWQRRSASSPHPVFCFSVFLKPVGQ